jgi:exodeoxyribonuclease VII small subunit
MNGIEEDLKYDVALDRLREIVSALERKEVKIDQLSKKVQEAKRYVDYCRVKLDETEAEITKIITPSIEE